MHWRSQLIHPGAARARNVPVALDNTYAAGVRFDAFATDLDRPGGDHGGRLLRLNIGLEETSDLIADLAQSLDAMDGPL